MTARFFIGNAIAGASIGIGIALLAPMSWQWAVAAAVIVVGTTIGDYVARPGA